MTRKARLLLGALIGAMTSIWLSGGATLLAIGANGLDRMPRPVEVLLALAFWPTMALGVPRDEVMRQHLLLNILMSVIGYAIAGALVGMVAGASRDALRQHR